MFVITSVYVFTFAITSVIGLSALHINPHWQVGSPADGCNLGHPGLQLLGH